MGTSVLTPKSPNPLTGLSNPVVGWHITVVNALDVLQGMGVIGKMGYAHKLETVDISVSPPIYQLAINRGDESKIIADTDWLVTDGRTAWGISESEVVSGYDVTAQGG